MSRTVLKLLSLLVIFMGIATLVPAWTWSAGPEWYGIVKVAIGVIAFGVAYSAKT
jgi:hypothetical protein